MGDEQLSERNWWENEDGSIECHLCKDPDNPVDVDDPETMFGLSGAPVHGKCGREAMERGKVVKVGERPRVEVPVRLEGDRIIGSAVLHPTEKGVRVEAHITDPAMAEFLRSPGLASGFSIAGGEA